MNAYKTAADEALKHAGIVEKQVLSAIRIQYDYAATPEVMRMVKEYDLRIQAQTFEEECVLDAEFERRDEEKLFGKLDLLKALGSKIEYHRISET